MAASESSLLWRASLATTALAFLACLVTVLVARLVQGGHPPLSLYVAVYAIPLAWLLALAGIALAIGSRRSVPGHRYRLALAANVAVIVLGGLIWLFWPWFVG